MKRPLLCFKELSNEIIFPCYALYLTHASCEVLVHSVNTQLKEQNSAFLPSTLDKVRMPNAILPALASSNTHL